MAKPSVVALLPIKAHSERVPGKNFRDFCGRPLFRWVLDALLAVPAIDRVWIDTDARKELAEHGLEECERVRLRDRRPDLRGDAVSMNLVLADDVAHVAADVYVMTHATNPLLRGETIGRALAAFETARTRGDADSLFSVCRVQTRFWREDGSAVNHDPANLVPTQQLEPWLEENSNLYVFSRESFAATGARIGRRPLPFPLPRWEAVDIDDAASWRHAELLARGLEAER